MRRVKQRDIYLDIFDKKELHKLLNSNKKKFFDFYEFLLLLLFLFFLISKQPIKIIPCKLVYT